MRIQVSASFIAILAGGALLFGTDSEPKPAGPRIVMEETAKDFGKVMQGDPVKEVFKFKNDGDSELVIYGLNTTCGCTAAAASTGPFRPGESGEITVTYDSRGKFGEVQKDIEIVSNDIRSTQTISIVGLILTGEHPVVTAGDVLFKGNCAGCHYATAKEKTGVRLYDSVCAMCHDFQDFPREKGKKAIAPDRHALAEMNSNRLRRIISEGVNNTSMPGFAKHVGGPLSVEQVESLVQYLSELRVQDAEQKLQGR